MITGHRPFQGNSATTVCFKIANRDPLQATALNSELPPEMDAVIARAIAKDPAQRYQRGVELALDIRDLRERLQPKPSSLSKRQAESRHSDKTIATCESSQSAVGRIDASVLRTLRASAGKLIAISALILILGLLTFHRTAPSRETAVRLATRPTERAVTSTQSNNESASASSSPQPVPPTLATSTLEVQITHHFGSAAVQLWIDNNLTYSQSLHAKATSHLVLFRGTHGYDTGRMLLPAGKHRIRVRVRSKTDGYDEQKTVSGDFAQGYSRILKVTFEGRAKDMHLLLK